MSPRFRIAVPLLLLIVAVVGAALLLGGPRGSTSSRASESPGGEPASTEAGRSGEPTIAPSPTPVPALGGTELYGFLPYWHVTETVAAYLDSVPVSTLGMFSVSARRNGAIDTRNVGYRRITSDLGRRIIAEAQARGTHVDLVFTSFGGDRNGILFGRLAPPARPSPSPGPGSSIAASSGQPSVAPWHRTVRELVELAVEMGVDGINVDIELLDELDREAYGEFLVALRAQLVAALPDARVSVATEAGLRGLGNALAAASAGVDR